MNNKYVTGTILIILFALTTPYSSGQTIEDYHFTGQGRNTATGLSFHRWRFYDAETGRFLQRDPISVYGGTSLYYYCENTPVNLWDPLGMDGWDQLWGVVQFTGGGLQAMVGYSLGAAGVSGSATGAGAPLGASDFWAGTIVAAHGVDTAQAGWHKMWYGEDKSTYFVQGLQNLGTPLNRVGRIAPRTGLMGALPPNPRCSPHGRSRGGGGTAAGC